MKTVKTLFTHLGSKVLLLLVLALTLSLNAEAFALDLQTALSKGLAGEVDTGYLGIPPGAGNEAQSFVNSVNTERRAAYNSLAEKNGVTPEIAGQATFEKRYPSLPVGTWVNIQGRWMQK